MSSIQRPNFEALRRARDEGDNALNSPRLTDALARDVDAMDADRLVKDATHAFSSHANQDGSGRTETARGKDAPVLSLGQGDSATNYRRCEGGCGSLTGNPCGWCVRCSINNPASPTRVLARERYAAHRAKPTPIWDSVPRQFPKDDHIDHEVEIAIEYRFEKGERGSHDYPGEPAHVTAYAAFLPERFSRSILHGLTHELLTTGGFEVGPHGMLTEESVHRFIQQAGERICDVIDAVKTEADEQAASVEDPEHYRR